ncbi:MAG TPA: 4-hydroxy-tetrahydrodipicolinate reductase, partial [Saprospiraceae bacterium]|nr:4-hydroxy-tetrahydrodipicolinate reductase [Saprospiraceae bacterium]
MNIALFGYGKMGKAIERIALERGHKIIAKIDQSSDHTNFDLIDVAIDFSTPDAAYSNIKQAIDHTTPIISGTTGWLKKYDEIVSYCQQKNGSFLYASNFSLGVNLFFSLNKYLASLIQGFGYDTTIIETHHTQKLDAPSGTAISLAEQILPFTDKKQWGLQTNNPDELPIISKRIDKVTGTHQIIYSSAIDEIE